MYASFGCVSPQADGVWSPHKASSVPPDVRACHPPGSSASDAPSTPRGPLLSVGLKYLSPDVVHCLCVLSVSRSSGCMSTRSLDSLIRDSSFTMTCRQV